MNREETLGQRLRRLRQAAELTQVDLAERAGTTQDHISDLERDEKTPGLDLCRRLAGACRVSTAELIGD